MAKFGINDILNAKTKAAGQQAQTDGYKEIYLSPYEVKAAQENTHQKLENIEELADSFLHVGQEQPSNLLRVVQEQQETIEKQSRLIADLIATLESWEQTAGYDGAELKERAKDLQLRERQDL